MNNLGPDLPKFSSEEWLEIESYHQSDEYVQLARDNLAKLLADKGAEWALGMKYRDVNIDRFDRDELLVILAIAVEMWNKEVENHHNTLLRLVVPHAG